VHRCVILNGYLLGWYAAYNIVRPEVFFRDERDGVIARARTAAAGVMYTRAVVDVLTRRWCDDILIMLYYCGDDKCICLCRVTVVRNVQCNMYNIYYYYMRYIIRWLWAAVCRHGNIICDCGGVAAATEDSSGRAVHLVEQQHHNYNNMTTNTQRSCAGRRRRRRRVWRSARVREIMQRVLSLSCSSGVGVYVCVCVGLRIYLRTCACVCVCVSYYVFLCVCNRRVPIIIMCNM